MEGWIDVVGKTPTTHSGKMSSQVLQPILRGFGANLYGQGVVILIQVAGVPILLHYWGVERYGEWLILFAIPAYLSITDLGFSISAANDMTARNGRGDTEGALAVFQSLTVLVYSMAVIGLGIVSLVITSLPWSDWLNISHLTPGEARWVLWFLAIAVLANVADGVNHAGFRANGDYALHVAINYNTILAQYASVWLVAALGHGPMLAAAAFAAVRCIAMPAVAVFLVRRHHCLAFGTRQASLSDLRSLVRPAMANVAMPLAQAINIQGMVLVVGAILGPASVVVFSILRTLTRLALSLLMTVTQAIEPELAKVWGGGDLVLLRTLYIRGLAISLFLGVSIALVLFLLGGWLLGIWTHGRVQMDQDLFFWLLASVITAGLWRSSMSLLKASNRHLHAAVGFLILSHLSVALAASLLKLTSQLAYTGPALFMMEGIMLIFTLQNTHRLMLLPSSSALHSSPVQRLLSRRSRT